MKGGNGAQNREGKDLRRERNEGEEDEMHYQNYLLIFLFLEP